MDYKNYENKKMFLLKKEYEEDRDCVLYIEFSGFECGHYFGGIKVCGACFCGINEEELNDIFNHYKDIKTIFTKKELKELYELNEKLESIGFGIKINDERYNKSIDIINKMIPYFEKLLSKENEKLFEDVIKEEKEYCIKEYYLTENEINKTFNNYMFEYQDRAIINWVANDREEFGEEQKICYGYDDTPYFNTEEFVEDLLEDENLYLELESGKIISYNL